MSDERFLCCLKMREGGIVAGYFTSVLATTMSAVSIAVFFQEDNKQNGHSSKLSAFSMASYGVFYLFCCRDLIRGIKEERRDKLDPWIILTAINALAFFGAAIAALAFFCMGTLDGRISPILVLLIADACAIIAIVLSYFTWGIVRIWKYLKSGNSFDSDV